MKTKYLAIMCAVLAICCSSFPLQAETKTAGKLALTKGQKIAFLGDSITAAGARKGGYCRLVLSALNKQGFEVTGVFAGIGGHKSNQMLARLEKDVLKHKPDWMTLSCGVNDVWHGARGVALGPYKKNITEIVTRAQAAGVKVMLLTSTMIKEDQSTALNQKLLPYNAFLKQLAKDKKCLLADLNTEMQEALKKFPADAPKGKQLTRDGVHMNALGNAMMARGVLKAFGLADDDKTGFVSLFNGKDLTGWDAKPNWWYVEDGAITSQSTPEKPCKKCNYLIWKGGKPADFELRLKYKLIGGNSGIQFRSQRRPDWDTFGYQADMDAAGTWTGCIFAHGRGKVSGRGTRTVFDEKGKKTITKISDPAKLIKHVKVNDWNEYRIIAKGPKLTLMINGVVMCEAVDNAKGKAAREGIIALQVHPGPPMKVQFKDIELKKLTP
ncbi:MAG: DUF1080 domain-containing protein [Phycisphaerales bacterium]|nr:DUF1080 domain-containing protein [Phycisphaerales bacterium]